MSITDEQEWSIIGYVTQMADEHERQQVEALLAHSAEARRIRQEVADLIEQLHPADEPSGVLTDEDARDLTRRILARSPQQAEPSSGGQKVVMMYRRLYPPLIGVAALVAIGVLGVLLTRWTQPGMATPVGQVTLSRQGYAGAGAGHHQPLYLGQEVASELSPLRLNLGKELIIAMASDSRLRIGDHPHEVHVFRGEMYFLADGPLSILCRGSRIETRRGHFLLKANDEGLRIGCYEGSLVIRRDDDARELQAGRHIDVANTPADDVVTDLSAPPPAWATRLLQEE